MKKYNLIILAGGEKGPLFDTYGCENKALFPIHGKPMLDWVIEAFHDSGCIKNIVVVGNEELESLGSLRYVRKLIPCGFNVVQNLLQAVAYIKARIYGGSDEHAGYLISFCDAVFLTSEIIKETISNIEQSGGEMVFNYVSKEAFLREGLPAERTYIPVGESGYTGSTIYYINKFSKVSGLLSKLSEMRQRRKDPTGILKVLDCNGKSFSEIEKTLSKLTDSQVKILISNHARLGMDIDKPKDVDLANKLLSNPWKHAYQKAKLIYNPKAGQGMPLSNIVKDFVGIKRRKFEVYENQEEYIVKIKEYLENYGIPVELEPTQHAGHATEIARNSVAENYDLVIAAGGDGTINEVINGMAGSEVALGVIPMGTANVFALEMNLPVEIRAAAQVIASGRKQRIDLGRVNERYFVCMAGVGFDATIIHKADSKLKKIYGALAYVLVGVKELFTYKFPQIVVKIDEQPILRKGYFVIINNGRYYGGNMVLASHADVSDGLLDVCIFKHKNILSVVNYLFGFSKGKIDKHLSLEYFQCKKVDILRKGKHGVHVDAEYMTETPVHIEVVPHSLTICV